MTCSEVRDTLIVLLERRVERRRGDSVQVVAPSVAAGRVAVGSCLLAFFVDYSQFLVLYYDFTC